MNSLHDELLPCFAAAKRYALYRKSEAIELRDLFHGLIETLPEFRTHLLRQGFLPTAAPSRPDEAIEESRRVGVSSELKQLLDGLPTAGNQIRARDLLKGMEQLLRAQAVSLFEKSDADFSQLSATPDELQEEHAPTKLPALESLAREMSPQLRNPVIDREKEIGRLRRILSKRYSPNPILIGEPGVGKTAIVEGFVSLLASATCPPALRGKRVFQITANDLMAGTSTHGSLEQRMKELVAELEAHGDEVILFIDEIHQLILGGGNNVGEQLKPALARGIFPCIGATTMREFNLMERSDPAFCRRFELLPVAEPNEEATCAILQGIATTLFQHHALALPTTQTLTSCVELAQNHLPHRRFPDKAIGLLDSACALAASEQATSLTEEHLRVALAELIGVPALASHDHYRESLVDLELKLSQRIIGQGKAIAKVCQKITRCKLQIDLHPRRPDGVFLFTGPSGVGKTELARQLSRMLTNDKEDSLIMIAMSEYRNEGDMQKLFGAPPSYVGYGEPTQLERELRRFQSGVLLLDEFEKAHPIIQMSFLNAFDEGRIAFGSGQVLGISHVTVIATANFPVGSAKLKFGLPTPEEEVETREELSSYVPTELINRFDEVIEFEAITKANAKEILTRVIVPQANRVFARHQIEIQLSDEAVKLILSDGYHRDFGVRNLQRCFENLIQSSLIKLLVTNPNNHAGTWLAVVEDGNQIQLVKS